MPVFQSSTAADQVFGQLFTELSQDEKFSAGLRDSGISIRFEHSAPECRIFVSADGVEVGREPRQATHTLKMTCDTAHALWLGRSSFANEVNNGRLVILGKVSKVVELMTILAPTFECYPKIVATHGIDE